MKDAPKMSRKEDSVGVMERRSMGQIELPKDAAMKDAPSELVKGESVLDMGQSKLAKPAAMKDAPTKSSNKESVCGMEQL
eukprot:CAMPEP_0201987842 /NCGR_PEP_ID=MMETSP0904-20121228/92010_1 /ASSEMBLY_ACC=CAM_ASM_000553 /TAXON_ID=420261 /ORGANISM="Thalassiosira antarctica, Strain CCMP982" /LENGTH=79 /DNA_ID=CAMNT_0048541967 /DNA_START=86 /DNA_END=325 /DNA_ORIENTATION=+